MVELFANSGDPDQTPHSAASDLGLHSLPVISLGVSSLQWVNHSKVVPLSLFIMLSLLLYGPQEGCAL